MAQATGSKQRKQRARRYHHGDLRAALLEAAEAELAEKGVEGFTLRGCAKRAGVSHAAPAHHFKDTDALLTALATEGFTRFIAAMEKRLERAEDDDAERFLALGLGYLDFALTSPALFRLMFVSKHADSTDEALAATSRRSFEMLLHGVARIRGDRESNPALMNDVTAAWAIVHGLANLMLSGHAPHLDALGPDEREAMIRDVIGRFLPETRSRSALAESDGGGAPPA